MPGARRMIPVILIVLAVVGPPVAYHLGIRAGARGMWKALRTDARVRGSALEELAALDGAKLERVELP
jgi:hypothetical protein